MKGKFLCLTIPLLLLVFIPLQSGSAQEKEGKKPGEGWLGVSIQDMNEKLAKSMDLKVKEGVLVSQVVEDSPAEKAGLKEEDVIVEFAGKKVGDSDGLIKAVRAAKPESKVKLVAYRDGEKKNFDVVVGSRPAEQKVSVVVPHLSTVPHAFQWNMADGDRGKLGLHVSELNEQLAAYFDTPDGGVLVEEVEKDGAGAKAGFKAGDVIVKIGKKNVDELSDLGKVLDRSEPGDTVEIEIMRKGARKSISAVLEKGQGAKHLQYLFEGTPESRLFERRLAVPAPDAPNVRIYRFKGDDDDEKKLELIEERGAMRDALRECIEEMDVRTGDKTIHIKVQADALKKQAQELKEMGKKLQKELQKNIRVRIRERKIADI